jgi:hypothetical protein
MVSLQNPPFSASSSWNTPVSSNATYTALKWPSSTGYNYTVSWDTYSPAVYVASSSDPVIQVSYPAGWGYPAGTVSIHIPASAIAAAGSDGEMVVIDGDVAYSFWQFTRTGSSTASVGSFGSENVVTGDGWGTKSPFLAAGTTAVGSSLLGGLLVKAETADGSIDHALQLVVDSKLVKSGFIGNAIAGDGSSASGIVQEGQLLAISPDTPMPSGLSQLGQEVFAALQKYGAYVVDTGGGATSIRAQANDFDTATMTALWHDMGSIAPLLEAVSGGTSSTGSTSSGSSGSTSSAGGTGTGSTSTGASSGTGSTGSTTSVTDPSSGGTVTSPVTSNTHTHYRSHRNPISAASSRSTSSTSSNSTSTNLVAQDLVATASNSSVAGTDTIQSGGNGTSTASNLSLLTQYAASSFAQSGPVSDGPSAHHHAWSQMAHTFTRPQASR